MNEQQILKELELLRAKGLTRSIREFPGTGGKLRCGTDTILNFSSNDYLNIASSPFLKKAAGDAVDKFGCGSGASRLMTGSTQFYTLLEQRLAAFKNYPAALVFGSGYMTNAGIIPALAGRNDYVFTDKLAHASIVDGVLLSRAQMRRFAHNAPDHLETLLKKTPAGSKRFVVTESVFSMDGDIAPLQDIAKLCSKFEATLIVDEAHATGVFGENGRGLVSMLGLNEQVDLAMGTMSKAMGSYGGFVACSGIVRELLVNRARSLIFSTALPPAVIGAALGALDFLEANPNAGRTLLERADYFRTLLRERGIDTGKSESQIIPVLIGGNERVMEISSRLFDQGIIASAIRAPTVPTGTERLRLSVTLAHEKTDIEQAAEIIAGLVA